MWLAEVFGPGMIDALVSGVDAFDLAGTIGREVSTEQEIRQRRESGSWVAWDLRHLYAPDEAHLSYFDDPPSRLPSGVRAVMPTLAFSAQAITVLTCAFVLDDESTFVVDRVLRAEHRSELRRNRRRSWVVGPEQTQRDAVRAVRCETREHLSRWVADHFPGTFAAASGARWPTVELMTYRTAAAEDDYARRGGGWQWALDLACFPMWTSKIWPDVRLVHHHHGDDPFVLTLEANETRLRVDRRVAPDGNAARWTTLAGHLNRSFSGHVALWATARYADHLASRLAATRDEQIPHNMSPRASSRQLRTAHQRLSLISTAQEVAESIAGIQGPEVFSFYDHTTWSCEEPTRLVWSAITVDSTKQTANEVARLEPKARDRLQMEAQLFSAAAGLRIQRQTIVISVVAVLLAAAALAVALIANAHS